MKILHVITGLQKAAGTSTFCGEVCNQLVAGGHDVAIALVNPAAPGRYPLDPRIHLISAESVLRSQTPTHNANYNIVHIHGLWSSVLHKVSCWAHARSIPVVWSTHGMTAPWALKHKWWKKCLPWHFIQQPDLKSAALIHCTTELEAAWNHDLGYVNTFIVPLGTTLPVVRDLAAAVGQNLKHRPKILLYVGRIYPVKALDNAIRAYSRMTPEAKMRLRLRFVGPDQAGHMSELMSLCESLGLSYSSPGSASASALSLSARPQVEFVGPEYDDELSAEYDKCDGLMLVSHTENFGATVIDALAHGKPVITSTKTPWKIVSDEQCGYWVDNSPESLARIFARFVAASNADLAALGRNGRLLVERDYAWHSIAKKLVAHYEEIA